MNTYKKGAQVRVTGAFTGPTGSALDPTNVYCQIKNPEGDVTAYHYGVDAALVRDSAGNYHVDIDADAVGTWCWRFYSTGSGKAADEGQFQIAASYF